MNGPDFSVNCHITLKTRAVAGISSDYNDKHMSDQTYLSAQAPLTVRLDMENRRPHLGLPLKLPTLENNAADLYPHSSSFITPSSYAGNQSWPMYPLQSAGHYDVGSSYSNSHSYMLPGLPFSSGHSLSFLPQESDSHPTTSHHRQFETGAFHSYERGGIHSSDPPYWSSDFNISSNPSDSDQHHHNRYQHQNFVPLNGNLPAWPQFVPHPHHHDAFHYYSEPSASSKSTYSTHETDEGAKNQWYHPREGAYQGCENDSDPQCQDIQRSRTRNLKYRTRTEELPLSYHIRKQEKYMMKKLKELEKTDLEKSRQLMEFYQYQITFVEKHHKEKLESSTACSMDSNGMDDIEGQFLQIINQVLERIQVIQDDSQARSEGGLDSCCGEARKTRLLPKRSVKILDGWFTDNISNPYPSRDQTIRLALDCGLTVEQVRKWFANKRNRSRNNRNQYFK